MDASPVKTGQVLAGKYRIERVLGEGGMGVVVEAHDISLERRVAIKFLLPEFVRHPEATQRFMREARAAAKIQSEHVARVIDVSTLENGAPYMVMEFLEGSDLSQVIEAGGALPIEDAALYVIQACEALAEAHAYGIIHRDLKPANLFLAEQAGGSRKIKVLDFGISKTLSATDPGLVGSLTRTSSMMGSPLYMSPEQMKSARDVDLRTDIWALGVILYETLSATPPFSGNSIPEIAAKILLEDPRPLGEIKVEIPQTLADVAVKALRKQPEMRFQNVGELAMALLPFAPNRARNNVERIIRVLNAAGMAHGEFLASLAPADQVRLFGDSVQVLEIKDVSALGASLLRTSGKKRQATLANFGHTRTERAPPRAQGGSRRTIAAALAAVAIVGTAVALVLRPGGSAPEAVAAAANGHPAAEGLPTAHVAASTGVTPSAPPAGSGPTVRPAALEASVPAPPPLEATPSLEEEDDGNSDDVPSTPPAAKAAAIASSSPAKPSSGAKAKKASLSATTSARPTRKASTATKPREKSYSGDFKSKFGSRK